MLMDIPPGVNNFYSKIVNFDWGSNTLLMPDGKNQVTYATSREEASTCERIQRIGMAESEKIKKDANICGCVWAGGLIPPSGPIFVSDAKKRWPHLTVRSSPFYIKIFDHYIFPELKKIFDASGGTQTFIYIDDMQSSHRTDMTLNHFRDKLATINSVHFPVETWQQMCYIEQIMMMVMLSWIFQNKLVF